MFSVSLSLMKKAQIFAIIAVLTLNFSLILTPKSALADSTCLTITRSLTVGSKDNSQKDVTSLQTFLNAEGYLSVAPTGYFGQMTFIAVKNFQGSVGLPAVGVVGPLTRAKLNAVSCSVTPAPVPVPAPAPTPVTNPAEPALSIKSLPYTLSNFSDMLKSWGETRLTADKTLEIKAGTTTNGAQIIIPGSQNWTNYKTNMSVFVKQSTLTMISRYLDDNNFLGCTFSGKYIEIIQRINGVSTVVASQTVEYFPYSSFFYNDVNLQMRVEGKTVGCSLIGSEDNVSYSNVDSKLLKGGVGLQTWVNAVNVSNIELRGLKVEAL